MTAAPSVLRSSINYLGPMDEVPVLYSEKYYLNNLVLEPHTVEIRDCRPDRERRRLETNGFALVDHTTAVKDFTDADEVSAVYVPEIESLIRDLTGARRVIATTAVLRWSERSTAGAGFVNSRPARFVHVDYNRESFDDFARQHLAAAGENPASWLQRRYTAFNIWRVLTPPPQDVPLALCDPRSVKPEDRIDGLAIIDAVDRPELRFGNSLYRYSPAHRWHWFSDMHPGEALVFKAFDSEPDAVQGCAHSGFDNPACPADAVPRSSVEIRAYAYY